MKTPFIRSWVMLGAVLVLLALSALAPAQTPDWCVSPDNSPVGCAEISLNPAALTGDFYLGETPLAQAQNPGRLVLPPGSQRIEVRNVQSSETGFGMLFIYEDTFATLSLSEGQVRRATVYPRKTYIRRTLVVKCDVRKALVEKDDVGCLVSLDGLAQPERLAPGQAGSYILNPGSHAVRVALGGAAATLWTPASLDKNISISAGRTSQFAPRFDKLGHLIVTLNQPGVVGDWYLNGVPVAAGLASLDTWVAPGLSHKVEVRNVMVTATPLIRPWKDTLTTAFVSSGQTRTTQIRLQAVLPGGTTVLTRPNCPVPYVTTEDDVVISMRWTALRADLAEQNADHLTPHLLLDGQDVGDITAYRRPVQGYNPATTLGCGGDHFVYSVHWDVPVGRLTAGTHSVALTLFADMELFDGWYTIPPGWLGPQENVFVVHAAGASTQDPFLGYWRSIDPGDGSTQWLTITGGGEDDIYYLAYKDDYASVCGGPNGAGSASGTIEPGTGYLHATGTYHCFDGSFSTEFSFRLKPIDANTLMEIGGSYPAVWHRVGS